MFLPVRNIHKTRAKKLFDANGGYLIINTNFGGVKLRGKLLGQNHKDILETLLTQEKKYKVRSDNSIFVSFKRYSFLKQLGRSTGNYEWLKQRIEEIRDFNFSIIYYTKDGEKIEEGGFGIIDKYRFEEDGLMSVKFTPEFTNFYRRENLLSYGDYVPKIAKLDEPFLKGVVRYMLQNREWSIYLSTLIENYKLKNLVSKNEITKFNKILKNEDYKKLLKELFSIDIIETNNDIKISIVRDEEKVIYLDNNGYDYSGHIKQLSLFDDI